MCVGQYAHLCVCVCCGDYILHFGVRIVFLFLRCCTSDDNISIPPIRGKCPEGTKGVGMLSAQLTEGLLLQICNCSMPPAAPSFPSCRKRRGRKGALGYGLVRPASEFRQVSMFQASFHTIVTSRASWYAPPDTGEIRFATSCLRTVAVNRRCSRNFDGYYLLAGQVVGAGDMLSSEVQHLKKKKDNTHSKV